MLYCFKQFDELNFDGLAGKCQKRQNSSPPSKFCAIRYLVERSDTSWGIYPRVSMTVFALHPRLLPEGGYYIDYGY